MLVQVSGITFRIKEHLSLATFKPVIGESVYLHHDSTNEHSDLAVRIIISRTELIDGSPFMNQYFLGYLKEKSVEQKAFHEGKIKSCKVHSYSYATFNNGKPIFNQNNEGVLGSITLDVDIDSDNGESGKGAGGTDTDRTTYQKDGKDYERITSFLSRTKHLYESEENINRLKNWQSKNENGLEMSARLGTLVHKLIEEQAKANIGTAKEILEKLGLKLHTTEQTVYNDELGLAGTYDALCTDKNGAFVIIDWKSSKKPQKSHSIQTSFYSHCVGAIKAYVICLGAENKQGYSVCTVDVEKGLEELKIIKNTFDFGVRFDTIK